MKRHVICLLGFSLFSFSYLTWASDGSSKEIAAAQKAKLPDSRSALCELLLAQLDGPQPAQDETHPVQSFFSMLGLMLNNSSGMDVFGLNRYGGLASVDRARELVGILRDKESAQRRSQISEIYQLFGRAAATGDDFNLAALLFSIERLTRTIDRELFIAGFSRIGKRTSSQDFKTQFMRTDSPEDPEQELNAINDAWSRLAPHHRAGFAEWLGRSFSEGVKSYTTTTIKFGADKSVKVTSCQMLPDLSMTLEDYISAHPGNKREVTRRYFRHVASKLLFIYGIAYSEDEGTSATPVLASPQKKPALWLQKAKQLLFCH